MGEVSGSSPVVAPGGQLDAADALLDALAGEVVLDAVAEDERDERQAEGALAAHDLQPGDAVELALERDGDLLLHLLGGVPGILGDHLRGGVGDVRVGLDRQLGPGIDAEDGDEQEHRHHQPAAVEAGRDETVNHCSTTASRVTTGVPASRPSVTTVTSPCCSPVITRPRSKTHGSTSTKA